MQVWCSMAPVMPPSPWCCCVWCWWLWGTASHNQRCLLMLHCCQISIHRCVTWPWMPWMVFMACAKLHREERQCGHQQPSVTATAAAVIVSCFSQHLHVCMLLVAGAAAAASKLLYVELCPSKALLLQTTWFNLASCIIKSHLHSRAVCVTSCYSVRLNLS